MSTDVKLLTPDEIKALRGAWDPDKVCGFLLTHEMHLRIVATLEALMEDRDAWKREAKDWKATADEWARAFHERISEG